MTTNNGWRGWMLVRGMLTMAAGGVFLLAPLLTALAAAITVGAALLVLGGTVALTTVSAREPGWGWALGRALVTMGAGALLLADPAAAVIGLALAFAVYFGAAGVLRIGSALAWRPATGWMWMFTSGLVGVLLAGLVIGGWPLDSFYIVGTLLGVEALVDGVAHVALGAASEARILPPRELPRIRR